MFLARNTLILLGFLLVFFWACKPDVQAPAEDLTAVSSTELLSIDSTMVTFTDTVMVKDKKTKKSKPTVFYQNFIVYKVPNELPYFPGCKGIQDVEKKLNCSQKKLMKFVSNNLKYPEEAFDKGIEGTSVVRFILDQKGMPIKEEITKSIGYGTDQAVLDIVKKMRKQRILWEPAKVKNRPVKVYQSLPVRFQLN